MNWRTIDGGGATFSTGGGYSLGGTIGQPDAQAAMSGGQFQITGGFWAVAASACAPSADINFDGHVDGRDAQPFVDCMLGVSSDCSCVDVDGGGLSLDDIEPFVSALLAG
jgi:hypothetical protein